MSIFLKKLFRKCGKVSWDGECKDAKLTTDELDPTADSVTEGGTFWERGNYVFYKEGGAVMDTGTYVYVVGYSAS